MTCEPAPDADVGPFALADPARNVALLQSAGCSDVTIETISEDVWVAADVPDASAFLELSLARRVPDPRDLRRVLEAAEQQFAKCLTADGVRLPSVALLCHATRKDCCR